MFPNFDSAYKFYANKTLDWLPMDTKELYQKNLKHRFNDLMKYGWVDNHFTYKFNSLGFRCDEFTSDPTIMFLGCSYTIGMGLPIEKIWPELVSQKLKMRCANLGIGGGSSDGAFRLCYGYIDKIKPQIVVFMSPPGIRFELVTNNSINNVMVSDCDYDLFKEWAIDENNNYFNLQKNILAIQMLCQQRNIKFVNVKHDLLHINYDIIPTISLARDLAHPGVEAQIYGAEKILSLI